MREVPTASTAIFVEHVGAAQQRDARHHQQAQDALRADRRDDRRARREELLHRLELARAVRRRTRVPGVA